MAQTVWFVDDDAPPEGAGTSWATAFDDLQDALDDAEEGDEIWIAEGTYVPSVVVTSQYFPVPRETFRVGEGLTLYGGFAGDEDSPAARDIEAHPTILSGDLNGDDGPDFANREDNAFSVILMESTSVVSVFDGLTITAGGSMNAEGRGGGVRAENSAVRFVGCTFIDNVALSGGGAVHVNGESLTIDDSTFERCLGATGGAVHADADSVEISDSDFIMNDAVEGGAAWLTAGMVALSGTTFSGNRAIDGGGLYVDSPGVNIDECNFLANEAVDRGGGMFLAAGATLLLANTQVQENRAEFGGGVHAGEGSTVTTITSEYMSNCAESLGGGMYLDAGANWNSTGTTLRENVAGIEGAGAYLGANGTATISDGEFIGNDAQFGGGGLYTYASAQLSIADSHFIENLVSAKLGVWGGGLCVVRGGEVLVERTEFIGNVATRFGGGAAFQSQIGTPTNPTLGRALALTVRDCLFQRNATTAPGILSVGAGARVFVTAPDLNSIVFERCDFLENASGWFAGAFSLAVGVNDPAVCTMDACRFVGNTGSAGGAMNNGGLVSNHPDTIFVARNCLFADNACEGEQSGGGAVVAFVIPHVFENCTFVRNVANDVGGVFAIDANTTTLISCILYDNVDATGVTPGAQFNEFDTGAARFSLIQNVPANPYGNVAGDPRFVDAIGPDGVPGTDDDDFRLLGDSPAIDGGDPFFMPAPGTSEASDLLGQPRVAFCRVDMGVLENQKFFGDCNDNGEPDGCEVVDGVGNDCNSDGLLDVCQLDSHDTNGNGIHDECDCVAADCNVAGGDGVVDIEDLLAVVNEFGSTVGACDSAPPGGDGLIDIDDLVTVINWYGRCE